MFTKLVDSIVVRLLNDNTILNGVGNELHLHTATGTRVLPAALQLIGKVHGIEKRAEGNAYELLIFGEKEFMLLSCTEELEFKLLYRAQLSDWISAGKFLSTHGDFVLLTAHSVLLRFCYKNNNCEVVDKYSCVDKSTLYCAHIHDDDWQNLIIFGGNAFGELLVWQPNTASGKDGKIPLLLRHSAHNGVIFSIDYSAEAQLLTTTSDDRSIKFWQTTDLNWTKTQLKLTASGFGHVARVFQNRIINYGTEIYAITVGEDSQFCVWQRNGQLVYKRRHQFGATIWNLEYEPISATLFTVGSTGNLCAYGLSDILAQHHQRTHTLPVVQPTENMAKIKFLTKKCLIGVTNKNRLVSFQLTENFDDKRDFPTDLWSPVEAVEQLPHFKCTVLEVHDQLIAICGYQRLTLLKYDEAAHEFTLCFAGQVLKGVIRALQFLDAEHFLLSDELGGCVLLEGDEATVKCHIPLPECREPWVTTALWLRDEFLLLSNRQGNLLVYACEGGTDDYTLRHTSHHPHGNLGATVLRVVEEDGADVWIQSAGHDGALRRHCLNKRAATLQQELHKNVPVTWVEEVVKLVDSVDLLLGFNDNHFVAWTATDDFIFQLPCGGGHRCWHFAVDDDAQLQLVYIRQQRVHLQRLPLSNPLRSSIRLPPHHAWHTRPCNALRLWQSFSVKETLLFSAGDDNLLKVSSFRDGHLQLHAELHAHISNIRTLAMRMHNRQLLFLFSGGGRAQLCISALKWRNNGKYRLTQRNSYTLQSETTAPRASAYSIDPETRIMCIGVDSQSMSRIYDIFVGCSDGWVRHLWWDARISAIKPGRAVHLGKCVLQLRVLAMRDALVLATTDGILQFYNFLLERLPYQLRHHASGVNALDVLWQGDKLHLLSGGDDQAVTYTALLWPSRGQPAVLQTLNLAHLHTAQVTAVQLSLEREDALYAYTSGVDQRLHRYNLTSERLEGSSQVCVADVKGLCVSIDDEGEREDMCYVYGCGLQVERIANMRKTT